MKCKHENGWIVKNSQDFELVLFDGDFVEADDVEVYCNNLGCQETKRFRIIGGIAEEIKNEREN